MSRRRKCLSRFAASSGTLAVLLAAGGIGLAGPADEAAQILQSAGVKGGLVVHLGCGEGKLTAALGAGETWLVQGLAADAADVEKARAHIRGLGLYGRVSVGRWAGKALPYVDNLVNLVVVEDLGGTSMDEVIRVLAPNGAACARTPDGWKKTVKPRPKEIDEWTHFLHDASNHAVARDSVVGPPRRLQWVGSPRYTRHHDRMSSLSAAVSAGGRLFYIMDEATRASILAPPAWSLIARDAFNGTVLWKRGIGRWHSHLQGLKSGPALLPRRLVAVGERVYVTLGLDAPLTALDAATGETVRTYEASRPTREVLLSEGVLFLVTGAAEGPAAPPAGPRRRDRRPAWWGEGARRIMAVRAASGEVLWQTDRWVLPMTLTAGPDGLYLHDGKGVVCLARDGGKEVWRCDTVPRAQQLPSHFAPTLLVYEDVLLYASGETAAKKNRSWYTEGEDTLTALSAKTGKVLWSAYHPPSGYASPEDVFVVGGLVWCGETTSGRAVGVFTGRDLHTGEVKSEFAPDVKTYWFHHRCYRGKATKKYLLTSRAGTEFIDVRAKHWVPNHWVRGSCLYGVMPCNGLLYAPPHPCACYLESKLDGFNALAPAAAGPRVAKEAGERLTKGPAYGDAVEARGGADDWPTYRHDGARSGRTAAGVPAQLRPAWQADVGGRLTSPVAAGGKVFVASVDAHSVHAFDAASGGKAWSFTAGGRVDSPPTVHEGRVLFGSADGCVYCLRASDGALAWRFRAAPMDQRLTAQEQVESVWPVHGSVLVRDGAAWCVAGRSMFLDGGLRLWRLDPKTGRALSETVLDDRESETGKDLQAYVSWLNMPVALPDVLSTEGELVYMRSQAFGADGRRAPLEKMPCGADADHGAPPATQRPDRAHLFSPTGFLDDSWWHRTYWMYGSTFVSGWCGYFLAGKAAPAGRILVFDDARVYGFGRKPQYFRWTTPLDYHLFAAAKHAPEAPASAPAPKKSRGPSGRVAYAWTKEVPLLARAMVLAGRTLFIAGPPELVDEPKVGKTASDPQVVARLAEHAAALEGRRGGLLWAVSADDGEKLAEAKLAAPPVFDGMAAAGGRLFLCAADGKLLCLAGQAAEKP